MGPCTSKPKNPKKDVYVIKENPQPEPVGQKPSNSLQIPRRSVQKESATDETSYHKEEGKQEQPAQGSQKQSRKSKILQTSLSIHVEPKITFSVSDQVHIRQSDFSKDYTMIKQLGRGIEGIIIKSGGYGQVYLAQQNSSNTLRAVKVIKYDKQSKHHISLFEELKVLKQLDHPNIVKVFDLYDDGKFCYMVLEYCSGGELLDQISVKSSQKSMDKYKLILKETDIIFVMEQLLRALGFLHQNHIAHRDVKPENLIYASKHRSSQLKLIDFGISKRVRQSGESLSDETNGTLLYMAPEALKGQTCLKSDIWSAGVLLHFLLTGNHPFHGKNQKRIQNAIERGVPDLNQDLMSPMAFKLVEAMLRYRPTERPSATQCLTFSWFKAKQTELQSPPIPQVALLNMRNFRSKAKLQQMLLMYIINLLATSDEKHELTKVFQQLDVNNNGKLCKAELLQGYLSIKMNPEEAQKEVQRIFEQIDENQNGEIDYSEFVMACIDKKSLLQDDNLNRAFSSLDRDNSGSLSLKELKYQFSGQIEEDVWRLLLKELEKSRKEGDSGSDYSSNDHSISRRRFILCMRQLIKTDTE